MSPLTWERLLTARSLESLQFPKASQVPKVPPKHPRSVLAAHKPQIQLLLVETGSCNLTENSRLSKSSVLHLHPGATCTFIYTRRMPSARDTPTASQWPSTTRFLQERRTARAMQEHKDGIPGCQSPLNRTHHLGSPGDGAKSCGGGGCKPSGCQKQKGFTETRRCENPPLSLD